MLPAKRITIGDILVLLLAFLLVVFLALQPFSSRRGSFCTLEYGDTQYRYSLTEDRTVQLESGGYSLTVEIGKGKAAIIASDCPDQVCVHTGEISKNGQAAVCVPAGVILHITDRSGDEEDFRVG